MHVLLFIVYGVALAWGILRIPFFRNSGIRRSWLLLFFALHVIVGCVHTAIAFRYYPGHGDTWDYFDHSVQGRHLLVSDLRLFLNDKLTGNYLTQNGLVLVEILFNFLSFDNIYINTLLFAFPVFLGNVALFRVFRSRFPGDSLTALTAVLLPSTLFWTSCLYKEGAIFALLGLLFYYFDRLLNLGWNGRRFLYCLVLFLGIVYFRPVAVLALLPALMVWVWLEKGSLSFTLLKFFGRPAQALSLPTPSLHPPVPGSPVPNSSRTLANSSLSDPSARTSTNPRQSSASLISWLIPLLLLAPIILLFVPALSDPLLRAVSNRQKEFQALEGGSRLYLPVLEASWNSALHVLPRAFRNGFFEPLPGSGGKKIYIAFSLELLVIWAIIVGAILRRVFRSSRPGASASLTNRPHINNPFTGSPQGPLTTSTSDPLIMSQMLQPTSFNVPPDMPNRPPFLARSPSLAPAPVPTPLQGPTFPFAVACLIFAIITLLQIGMIIPFAGAIVRYRSIALPFLLAPFLYSLRYWRPFDRLSKTLSEHIFSP